MTLGLRGKFGRDHLLQITCPPDDIELQRYCWNRLITTPRWISSPSDALWRSFTWASLSSTENQKSISFTRSRRFLEPLLNRAGLRGICWPWKWDLIFRNSNKCRYLIKYQRRVFMQLIWCRRCWSEMRIRGYRPAKFYNILISEDTKTQIKRSSQMY